MKDDQDEATAERREECCNTVDGASKHRCKDEPQDGIECRFAVNQPMFRLPTHRARWQVARVLDSPNLFGRNTSTGPGGLLGAGMGLPLAVPALQKTSSSTRIGPW
jgi:hypothetical protein